MKNLIILLSVIFAFTTSYAQKSVSDYVKTEKGITFYQNLNHGVFNFLNGKIDGKKDSYSKDEVLEYKINGEVYTKLPEIKDKKYTGEYVFMKAVSYQSGLKLYEYTQYDVNGNKYKEYYVFENDKFVVDVNLENYQTLSDFFTGKIFDKYSKDPSVHAL